MDLVGLKPKESSSIINALQGGVVPRVGIQHMLVGRAKEADAIIKSLENVASGNSEVRFWIGDFGSGKSFMLQLIETLALRTNFVVSTVDFTPVNRLYSSDGKARALYSEIITKILVQTDQDGNALMTILDQWIEKIMSEVVKTKQIDFDALSQPENSTLVIDKIIETTRKFSSSGGFEFGQAISKYYEGYVSGDTALQESALRWLRGQYTAKTDSLRELGIREIINDNNYYEMLKNFAELFVAVGYQGFVINLDEAINLYKIAQSQTREKNYERILSIYNDCTQGIAKNLFINFGGTRRFLEDERRGLFGYDALKGRLSFGKFEDSSFVDLSQPVIYLQPLSQEDIFTLLSKLKTVFEQHYTVIIPCTREHITRYMEGQLNRPGASEFLTPRQVIREFLQILNIARQNPETSIDNLLDKMFGGNSGIVTKDSDDHDDDIEVL
jgi:ABC-type dipeptide/oligopeptide/nickel transport system ATPase component